MTVHEPQQRSAISWRWTFAIVTAACLVTLVPGCSGCRKGGTKSSASAKKKKDKEEEKQKRDFEFAGMRTLPAELRQTQALNRVKPGHYHAGSQPWKANNFDFQGELLTTSADTTGLPLRLPHTRYSMQSLRPAALPKGVQKDFETLFFVPSITTGPKTVRLHSVMRGRRGGREVSGAGEATTSMPDHQYYVVVLASNPDAFAYLNTLKTVSPADGEQFSATQVEDHYLVSNLSIEQTVPVPENPFAWTSIAYVIWDEVDPQKFVPDQQLAMVDWLHWGGQLIISAPDSLDLLKGSFLEPYLPADNAKSLSLSQPSFDELNAFWSKPVTRNGKPIPMALEVLEQQPMRGVELKLRGPACSFVPDTGSLVAERLVGNGRVLITSFSLTDARVRRWNAFDCFVNNCLFRLPPRRFQSDLTGTATSGFAGAMRGYDRDARVFSGLRYFSRDAAQRTRRAPTGDEELALPAFDALDVNRDRFLSADEGADLHLSADVNRDRRVSRNEWAQHYITAVPVDAAHAWRFAGYTKQPRAGVGGWNDASGPSEESRAALREAAGISIPNANFVLRTLAVYLLVLVPVNWAFFRLIGRVEWAWIAAPLIAIAGAIAVVRFAQLDIGFVRSRTEIAVLEIQGGYHRAHLTRYTALYTSLSTAYQLQFDNVQAVAQPFPADLSEDPAGEKPILVTFQRDRQAAMSGFQVSSSSTGFVHSEEMFDLNGALRLEGDDTQGWAIRNDTQLTLQGAGLLRNRAGTLEVAWLGELASKTTRPVSFAPAAGSSAFFEQWNDESTSFSHDRQIRKVLAEYDKDDDDVLSEDELPTDHELRQNFEQWDQPTPSGTLDRNELMGWCRASRSGAISLGRLFDLTSESLDLVPGDARLVAWTREELAGNDIRPRASQNDTATFVLAHLARANLLPPQRDENYRVEVADEIRAENELSIGARYTTLTDDMRKRLAIPDDVAGVLVGDVLEDSPAAQAGIQTNDVIIEYDGKPVVTIDGLRFMELTTPPDRDVEIKFIRNGAPTARRLRVSEVMPP